MLSFPYNLIAYAAIAALIAAGGFYAGYRWEETAYLKFQASVVTVTDKAKDQAAARQKQMDDASFTIEKASIQKQQVIVTQTQTVIKKVPVYVTAKTDATFPLPCGFVRLHDASASGKDPADIALPAGFTDEQACPTKASDAATIIAENYGQYRTIAQQLSDLQDWVLQEAAVLAKGN